MYCINPNDDEPIFLLDCQIGQDPDNPEDKFIDGVNFARELLYMDGEKKKRMWIYINSPGGEVSQGEAIYGAMLLTKTKVNTFCFGEAASIAGVIFQGGYKRVMLESARLMYHNAYVPLEEGEEMSPGAKKALDVLNGALAKMISSRSWKDVEAVKKMMAQTTYINAEDAKASDLCDEIRYNADLNAPATEDAKARWQYANKILNKLIPTTLKNKIMSRTVAKKLKLNEEANDESVEKAIDNVLNKANQADAALKEAEDAKKEAAEAKAALDAVNKKLEELEAANKEKEEADAKAKAEAEVAAVKAKAKAKILETAQNRGLALTAEALENYEILAGTDEKALNAVIKTIENMPVVRAAAKLINPLSPDPKNEKLFDVAGKDKFGMDVIVNTSKAADYMNRQVLAKARERFN